MTLCYAEAKLKADGEQREKEAARERERKLQLEVDELKRSTEEKDRLWESKMKEELAKLTARFDEERLRLRDEAKRKRMSAIEELKEEMEKGIEMKKNQKDAMMVEKIQTSRSVKNDPMQRHDEAKDKTVKNLTAAFEAIAKSETPPPSPRLPHSRPAPPAPPPPPPKRRNQCLIM